MLLKSFQLNDVVVVGFIVAVVVVTTERELVVVCCCSCSCSTWCSTRSTTHSVSTCSRTSRVIVTGRRKVTSLSHALRSATFSFVDKTSLIRNRKFIYACIALKMLICCSTQHDAGTYI